MRPRGEGFHSVQSSMQELLHGSKCAGARNLCTLNVPGSATCSLLCWVCCGVCTLSLSAALRQCQSLCDYEWHGFHLTEWK